MSVPLLLSQAPSVRPLLLTGFSPTLLFSPLKVSEAGWPRLCAHAGLSLLVLFPNPASLSLLNGLSETDICSWSDVSLKAYHVALVRIEHRVEPSFLSRVCKAGAALFPLLLSGKKKIFLNLQNPTQRSLSLGCLPRSVICLPPPCSVGVPSPSYVFLTPDSHFSYER